MKKNLLLVHLAFYMLNAVYAQNPLVKEWDYRFGGTIDDVVNCFQQTSDGGYIMGGYSFSGINGDKTQANWDASAFTPDYWIVKTDASGIKQWDKTFGGTGWDECYALYQTADGGYLFGGRSSSGISGDKTQSSWGSSDYWIVKTDALGNKQWDKRFGGISEDELYSLRQTADGGYILGGISYSNIGGDKTQDNWGSAQGTYDYWIVKTDAQGVKQWDKTFGGTDFDALLSLQQTTDGGYILGGNSESGISGNKTQAHWGLSGWDFWIVKTDALGNMQWDKVFGGINNDGLYSLQQTADGGYILGGASQSQINGDKTQANWDTTGATSDYWIVKTDASGNKQWDKTFGGTESEDGHGNIIETSDFGYLKTGTSFSNISGDKTEANLGAEQVWMVKMDSLGNKQWDKTAHYPGINNGIYELAFAVQSGDLCYTVTTYNTGGIGGDKTQPNWDMTNSTYDYWIIKYCDTTDSQTGSNEFLFSDAELTVQPNPFVSSISITIQKQNTVSAALTIKNIFGQTVFSKQLQTSNFKPQTNIDLSFLSQGIYFVDAIIDGKRTVKKIVKE